MIISLVVAASENNVIGKNNQLVWHLPKDMKFFKNVTWGMPVVMGRKTFEAIGNKPLSGRKNIVITRQPGWKADGVSVVNSVEAAATLAEELNYKEIFVIGGGQIYMIAFDQANKIYMTRVHADLEGDTYFPVIEKDDWTLVSKTDNPADEKHAYAFSFQLWERKVN
ncbi:MAG TPA: dihydrofolate reductase [Chitinophagaceae bacterium]|nr:dihydrofolate reductase [Chitinophagaceae bacterium]